MGCYIRLEGDEGRANQPYDTIGMAAGSAPINGVREAEQVAQTATTHAAGDQGPPRPGKSG